MTVAAAPRLDERLRRFIAGSPLDETPAAITRAAGELAWELGLARPSYQQVRLLVRASRTAPRPASTADALASATLKTLEFLYQYPGPGLADWYRRYLHGEF